MDPDRDKEEHGYVDDEKQRAFFASLINNLKCDVEKSTKVNHEAQQANALLTKELERYKEKEKHFAKDKTIESEYYKKIKLLNDEISNLKSQACQNDKTFTRENGNFDEYTDQTLQMLPPKEDNVQTGKQGLGPEKKNDFENPSLLKKAKELERCLYNIDEMGQDFLFDHKIIFEEELKCEAEKCLKVKQKNLRSRIMALYMSDEAKIKFDTEDLETINTELEFSIASLLKENEHLEKTYQNMFDSIKRSQFQTKSSNITQNEAENLKFQLFEFEDKKFDKIFQKIESMRKKKFDSRISSDFLQKSLYDSDALNVQSESRGKKIIF
nr:pyruvate, phosphate dikinase regulatory protein, chloroplastic [Tanacetum cinerariifolium]